MFDIAGEEDEEVCRGGEECAYKEEGRVWARASRAEWNQARPSRVESSQAGLSLGVGGETAVADRDIARRLNG